MLIKWSYKSPLPPILSNVGVRVVMEFGLFVCFVTLRSHKPCACRRVLGVVGCIACGGVGWGGVGVVVGFCVFWTLLYIGHLPLTTTNVHFTVMSP